jgi:hypothetical protein
MPSQTLSSNKVSVTKLCCPVCWRLFHILNMENAICGCHPTVTPLVLPETLPKHVSEEMISHLRALLSSQLRPVLSRSCGNLTTRTMCHVTNTATPQPNPDDKNDTSLTLTIV